MKILRFLPLAGVAFLMASCQQDGGGLSSATTQTDSLMYYLGQMNAGDYMREAERDTTLKETSSKQAYMDGIRAGLNALKDGDENYNKGVMMGMQMAANMISFSEQMDVTIDKSAYTSSLSSALATDTMPNVQMAQMEFRRLMTSIENAKKEKDEASSRESLSKEANSAGLPKIEDDLYGKVTNSANGEELKKGDEVTVALKITKMDGEAINMPVQEKGRIGNNRNYPAIVSSAMEKLKSGETGEYMTTAYALTNGRPQQLGLEANDVVKFTVTPTLVPAEEPKDEAADKAAK